MIEHGIDFEEVPFSERRVLVPSTKTWEFIFSGEVAKPGEMLAAFGVI